MLLQCDSFPGYYAAYFRQWRAFGSGLEFRCSTGVGVGNGYHAGMLPKKRETPVRDEGRVVSPI